ncbi:LOW QUALITY PROTEIN: hypothetical protein V2J09_004499 [Rumex salicifolius]
MDLTNTLQRPNEPKNDFIDRWRSLGLQCPENLSEEARVQMCTNNLILELVVHVGSVEPCSFDALISKACDIERQSGRRKASTSRPQLSETREHNNKMPQKRGESMATFVRPTNRARGGNNPKPQGKGRALKKSHSSRKKRKEIPFDDDDDGQGFSQNLRGRMKSERQMMQNIVHIIAIISHSIKDCYVLKDIIEEMVNNGEIEIEEEASKLHVASSNTFSMEELVEALPSYPSPPRTF